jgi:hypothetical protein
MTARADLTTVTTVGLNEAEVRLVVDALAEVTQQYDPRELRRENPSYTPEDLDAFEREYEQRLALLHRLHGGAR